MKIVTTILIFVLSYTTNVLADNISNDTTQIVLSEQAINNIKALDALYMKSTKVKSKFIQKTNLGDTTSGWFMIEKPGRARVEYDNIPIRLIANDNTLLVQNIKDKTKSFLPIKSSPFYYLLQTNFSFFSEQLSIIGYVKNINTTEIKFISKKNPELGNINIVLNNNGELIEWIVTDAKGIITTISLIEPSFSSGAFQNKALFNIHKVINIKYIDAE